MTERCGPGPAIYLVSFICFVGMLGCGTADPTGVVAGRPGIYDYSPSVILEGNVLKLWWCGVGRNPDNSSQNSDTILYESIDQSTHEVVGPEIVMAEGVNTWDSVFTCNPRVVEGSFANPLGDGNTYTYEMFYVATSDHTGIDNSIGAAFSNDGVHWSKYPQPVITYKSIGYYGVGQPAAYNEDQKSSITVYYENDNPYATHIKATSSDGLHFTDQGVITRNGLDPTNAQPSWGDMGYDPSTGYWYAAYNLPTRAAATTGGVAESGQFGVQLYRIPNSSLFTGATPWAFVKTIDTNLTGFEANFIASLLHDKYGNINTGPYPAIELYTSISDPRTRWSATPSQMGADASADYWDIGSYTWEPGQPLLPLNRYSNLVTYEVTTGWTDPAAGFKLDLLLGHLYESPQNGATVPFYGCKSGTTDYFVSLDNECEGQYVVGLEGFGYAKPVAGMELVPLYRCNTGGAATFVSKQANCEFRGQGTLLGYAQP